MKKLTPENWLEPDPIMSLFVKVGPEDPQPCPMSGEDWLRAIVIPTLDESVPKEVKDLFETVRGVQVFPPPRQVLSS